MCLRALPVLFALVLGAFVPCLAQQPTGPATLENLLNADEPQKPTALPEAEATRTAPKRPVGCVVRPKDGVKHPDLDKAWAEYDAAVAKVVDQIRAAMIKQFDAATAKGDLDAAEKWQMIREKFEQSGNLPAEGESKVAVTSAGAEFRKAKDSLARAYETVVKALTVEKKIAEAKVVRDEWRSVDKSAAQGPGFHNAVSARFWRYVEGGAVTRHHPRVSRIMLIDADGKRITIARYVADNCFDQGEYVVGTVSHDFGAEASKSVVGAAVFSTFNGGLRAANYAVQYSHDNVTWITCFGGVMSNRSACGLQDGTVTVKGQ